MPGFDTNPGTGGPGGTSVHGELDEREAADGHPIAAVTGLEAALAAAGTSAIKVATLTLTANQINALFTTPVTVVAGIAGKVIWPLGAFLRLNFGTVQFTIAAPELLSIGNPDEPATNLTIAADAWLVQTADVVAMLVPTVNLWGLDSGFVEVPLKVYLDTADPTDDGLDNFGDGTIDLTVLYREITV